MTKEELRTKEGKRGMKGDARLKERENKRHGKKVWLKEEGNKRNERKGKSDEQGNKMEGTTDARLKRKEIKGIKKQQDWRRKIMKQCTKKVGLKEEENKRNW